MHWFVSTFRTLQIMRENLEEEAIVMKDVPGWKVGKIEAFAYTGSCPTCPLHNKSNYYSWPAVIIQHIHH